MTTTTSQSRANPFLERNLTQLFVKMAAPIIAIMMVNGLLNIVDAIFLGRFVSAQALSAVTVVFPMFMILIALSSLVGSGAASILSRALGAGDLERANRVFGSAQRLSLLLSLVMLGLFLLFGHPVIGLLTSGDETLARLSSSYITPIYLAAPMTFILSLQYDTLRSEGRVPLMTGLSVGVTLLNIIFNYLLIVVMELGVLGSALGTIAAQSVAFMLLIALRLRPSSDIKLLPHAPFPDWIHWREMLALGLPSSLNFLGVSLMAGVVIFSVQAFGGEDFAVTVAAYGVVQRINTFAFFPILGLSLASQAIIGNNYGAKAYHRSNTGLMIALGLAAGFALLVELVFITCAGPLGALFVSEPAVIAEVKRILPVMVILFIVFATNTMLASYFQAIGDARRAALFGLAQIYVFTIPMTLILPRIIGEWGIWIATPIAQAMMATMVLAVLFFTWKTTGRRFGLLVTEDHHVL